MLDSWDIHNRIQSRTKENMRLENEKIWTPKKGQKDRKSRVNYINSPWSLGNELI